MGKPMETLQDLIEEAKVRTVGWAICIFGIAYFLTPFALANLAETIMAASNSEVTARDEEPISSEKEAPEVSEELDFSVLYSPLETGEIAVSTPSLSQGVEQGPALATSAEAGATSVAELVEDRGVTPPAVVIVDDEPPVTAPPVAEPPGKETVAVSGETQPTIGTLPDTSKSMWMNFPIAFLIFFALRYLSLEVELRWKVRPALRATYLSHLQKKKLPVDDPCLSMSSSLPRWKRKIDSPPIEAAINDFINKILQDFVIDLWYSSITPDMEAPELIRVLLLDVLGEISGRVKEINLVDLLTRDMVDLIGNHLELYRRNQSQIGADVMGTLSFVERDERLKHHLIMSKELHPALMSPECEYKVLQRLIGGVLAIVLRPREAQCPLVMCFSRELLTCLVMQPVMNFASPGYINELIEYLFLTAKDDKNREMQNDKPTSAYSSVHGPPHNDESILKRSVTPHETKDMMLGKTAGTMVDGSPGNLVQPRSADWARVLDAATQRRTQVLAPENLENMWTRGRNYKKKAANLAKAVPPSGSVKSTGSLNTNIYSGNIRKELPTGVQKSVTGTDEKSAIQLHEHGGKLDTITQGLNREASYSGEIHFADKQEEDTMQRAQNNRDQLKRSSSTSALHDQSFSGSISSGDRETALTHEFYSDHFEIQKEELGGKVVSGLDSQSEVSLLVPKLRCRVIGAYFEKISSKSFAVYSIAIADAENKIWIVKRRYRNFERLHRHLKDIPNYALHLPPKRFLSSSIDDSFVHQRCILLDRYLQDLLAIPNVAEQHEVWDFFSLSSKNYSFGKSTSVMKTLAVNVDDAMDDIVRQFKGVSDGIRRKVVGTPPPSLHHATFPSKTEGALALLWNDDISRPTSSQSNQENSHNSNLEMSHSLSDDEVRDDEASSRLVNGWHSDNELNRRGFPPRVVKRTKKSGSFNLDQQSEKFDRVQSDGSLAANPFVLSDTLDDRNRVPPEWTPPNVSVPLLNLVDNIFQLNRRGWLRRQVFWISKQILQLMMEDAIDDWLVREIHWLRQDDVIAQGIRWVQDVLWPNGKFFKMDDIQLNQIPSPTATLDSGSKVQKPSSFELQLEAARRASDVKKMLLGGAPTTLVSLIGPKQYRRCAKDMYYFLQSSVCMKQLAYGMLELLIVSIFPELRHLVKDIHHKARTRSAT